MKGTWNAETPQDNPAVIKQKRFASEVELDHEDEVIKSRKLDETSSSSVDQDDDDDNDARIKSIDTDFIYDKFNRARSIVFKSTSKNPVFCLEDPYIDFFIRIIRYIKDWRFTASPDDEAQGFWDSDWMKEKISPIWLSEVFVFLLVNDFKADEEFFIEYFDLVNDVWYKFANLQDRILLLTGVSAKIISNDMSVLFAKVIDQLSAACPEESRWQIANRILKELSNRADEKTEDPSEISVDWMKMCVKLVEKFPEVASSQVFRIQDFAGDNFVNHRLLIHFLPVLRVLLVKSSEELKEFAEEFSSFELGEMGDLGEDLPMGLGGLKVVELMFFHSQINGSAFSQLPLKLRTAIVKLIFDAVLLEVEAFDLFKILFEAQCFSMWEAYLKYCANVSFSPEDLHKIFVFGAKNIRELAQLNFLLALIAYYNVPESVWTSLRAEKVNDSVLLDPEYLVDLQRSMSHYPIGNYLNLSTAKSSDNSAAASATEMNLRLEPSEFMEKLSETISYPCQYNLARIFLARACGIPLETTNLIYFQNEVDYWWPEVVGFINFHVSRMAVKSGCSDMCLKFTPVQYTPV